jgi:hypothetical protein
MSNQLLFWVVVRDSKGKWTKVYDPEYRMKEGQRFAFEVRADEYVKLMTKKDKAAQEALAARQGELL